MKIIVQYDNTKFINNLDSLKDHEVLSVQIDNNIYQIEQKINPDIYLLVAENITNEEIHFCQNHPNKKIIVYNHTSQNIEIPNTKVINYQELPSLYNPNRFFDQHTTKDIEYSYFLDNDKQIPDDLLDQILPNKINSIKLFNNAKIQHEQNLGFLSENDKAQILNRTKNYICHNGFYAIEAALCGCKVVDTKLNSIQVDPQAAQTYSDFFESLI